MTDELKPCPFCGRDAECLHIYAGEEIVRCENEGCHVRPCVTSDDMDTSMALWNQRTESDKQEAVAFSLRWPGDSMVDLGRIFDTEAEATKYVSRYAVGGSIVPLFTHSAEQDRIDAERWRWLKMRSTVGEQRQIMSTPWGQWDAFADAAIAKGASK